MIKNLFYSTVCFLTLTGRAQSVDIAGSRGIVFSAVNGFATKPDTLLIPSKNGALKKADIQLEGTDRGSFTILSLLNTGGKNNKLVIAFEPPAQHIRRSLKTYGI